MRVLHIVGTYDKRWAISNRAHQLAAAQNALGLCEADIAGKQGQIDSAGYDLLHVHSYILLWQGHVKDALKHAPYGFEVISERTLANADYRSRAAPYLKDAAFGIVKNPRMLECLTPYMRVAPCFVPNGVDVELFAPRTLRVGWCGNKRHDSLVYKGVALIREAVDLLAAQWGGVVDVEFVEDPGDCPRTVLPQSDIAEWYRTLDLYVQASEGEGCSNTVNEALATGLPVVSTDAGIAHELAMECDLEIVPRTTAGIKAGIEAALSPTVARRRAMMDRSWGQIARAYQGIYEAAL